MNTTKCTRCPNMIRPRGTLLKEFPNTLGEGAFGMCDTCYRHSHDKKVTRAVLVGVTPETVLVSRLIERLVPPEDYNLVFDALGMERRLGEEVAA